MSIANNGSEAVRILSESNEMALFDMVFMDLQMPEMDGFTATKLLRAQPRLQGIANHCDDRTCPGGRAAALPGRGDE